MYLARDIEKQLTKALKQFPACLITGPRQAGKSTLLMNTLKSYRYVSLDDPFMANLAKKDPKLFLDSYPSPLIIDEIQYAPELLRYLKILIDKDRRNYGQYVLTGSQIFSLMKGVSESLAGRIAIFHLYPLSLNEIQSVSPNAQYDDEKTINRVIEGFYPEFFINPNIDPNLWFSSYIATYIERDVRNIKSITDISRFQTFIALLAARAGQLLNISQVANACGISQPTAKDWISILEATYLIYLLKPYHNNVSKRLVKSPKLYFIDSGILCYLLGITTSQQLLKSPLGGNIFENMILMEMRKRYSIKSENTQFFFYRTTAGVEVDLILKSGTETLAYEIKFSKTLSAEMASGLSAFQRDHPCDQARVLSLHKERVPIKKDIMGIHWSEA